MTNALYSLACVAIFLTGAYRLHHIDARATKPSIRIVFWAMTSSAATCAISGYAWSYVADWPDVMLAMVFAAVQVRTAMIWREGVPRQYLRRDCSVPREWNDERVGSV